ncbi:MAG: type 4a pilus biogenesis protein PilO [Acidobacteria bacterium]|nr:type 4a pilus biogenesis protein PilO [Acidobacteriota bacterium]
MLTKLKLKRSEKRAIKLGITVVLLVIFLNLVVFPLRDSYVELTKRKKTLTSSLVKFTKKLQEAKGIEAQIKSYQKEIKQYSRHALEGGSAELAQVALEELANKLAKAQGLTVTNTYKERSKKEKYGYIRVSARITVRGDYDAIIRFLEAIQQAPELIATTEVSLKHYRGYEATVTVAGLSGKEKS